MPEKDKSARSSPQLVAQDLAETLLSNDETASLTSPKDVPASSSSWVGRRLGKYEVTAVLGVGGMGVVLKAHDPSIDRDVAVKVLPEQMSKNKRALDRFLAEAKAAGQLNHPNTVTVYEIGVDRDVYFIVMELVCGGSSAERLEQRGGYSVLDATRICVEACRGLAAAHRLNLVHRDVKPANLLITDDFMVKVADFGLAKHIEGQSMMLTQEGNLVGTPFFMSPEQCKGVPVDARGDIYALGATYFNLLTGQCPFRDAGSVVQVMFAHCNADPPDPRGVRADLPMACTAIIQRSMAKLPEQRYQSMYQMRADLEAVLAALSGAVIQLPSASTNDCTDLSVLSSQAPSSVRSSVQRRLVTKGLLAGLGLLSLGGGGAALYHLGKESQRSDSSGLGDNLSGVSGESSGRPIRIGILHSLSGTMGQSGASVVDATLLAVDQLNRNGGVLGRVVEPVVADGRSDPSRFPVEARKLIDEEQVCVIFGCWTSASRKTIVPLFEELDHLLVYPLQYEGIEASPNVIYMGATPNQQVIPAIRWLFDSEKKRRFFLVGSDYVYPRVAHEIIKDVLQELGAELVGEAFLPLASSNVQPIIRQILSASPDAILNSINGSSNLSFFEEFRSAGLTAELLPTMSFSIAEEEFRHLDVSAFVGHYAAWNYFQSLDTDENKAFVASYREKFGPQRVLTDPMESAYVGVKLWAQGVVEAGTTDVRKVRRAMLGQRINAPSGKVRIDSATQHIFKTPRIGRIHSDGQFSIVWSAVEPEEPMPYAPSRSAESWRAFLSDLYREWGGNWSAPVG
jgi:urea transport system substrate-binding protein